MTEDITPSTVECWRINYGLDKRSPHEAARWWSDAFDGKAPAGAVAALGTALDALEASQAECARLRADAERMKTAFIAVSAGYGLEGGEMTERWKDYLVANVERIPAEMTIGEAVDAALATKETT